LGEALLVAVGLESREAGYARKELGASRTLAGVLRQKLNAGKLCDPSCVQSQLGLRSGVFKARAELSGQLCAQALASLVAQRAQLRPAPGQVGAAR
jgi:hypothetical protein